MLIKRADDYQSWYIEEQGYGILIDPWLDNKMNPDSSLLIQRNRETSNNLTEENIQNTKVIIITSPFKDHLHIPSLELFEHKKLFCNNQTRRKIERKNLKFLFLAKDKTHKLGPFSINSFRSGFPYQFSSFSFSLSNQNGKTILYEGHTVKLDEIINKNLQCDLAILTADSVKLFGVSLSMGEEEVLNVLKLLNCNKLMITGSNPESTTGLISRFLKIKPVDVAILKKNGVEVCGEEIKDEIRI